MARKSDFRSCLSLTVCACVFERMHAKSAVERDWQIVEFIRKKQSALNRQQGKKDHFDFECICNDETLSWRGRSEIENKRHTNAPSVSVTERHGISNNNARVRLPLGGVDANTLFGTPDMCECVPVVYVDLILDLSTFTEK